MLPTTRLRHRSRPAFPLGTRVALITGAVALAGTGTAPTASAGTLTGTLYRESGTPVATWVAANPGDPRTPVISSRIGSQPAAHWLVRYDPSGVQQEVSTYVSAANAAGQVPQLVAYMIPNRDCGGASAGGAPDLTAYQAWVSNFVKGLGTRTVIVVMEPDSLALQTCLSSSEASARASALAQAVRAVKAANVNAKVYLDAGHSNWNPASEAANRLKAAGVSSADGFYTNSSNFRHTADEIAFGKNVLAALGNPANLHQVIDVSRNGNGPLGSEWCDPAGRLIGRAPTLATGESTVDAFLWLKPPGESDGCVASAGAFVPDLAYQLAGGGTATTTTTRPTTTTTTRPTTTTTRPTTTTTRPTTTTTRPTTTPAPTGTAPCSVSYRVDNQWSGGFTASLVVRNTSPAPVSGWTLAFTFPGTQRVVNLWNGAVTQSGAAVSVRDAGHNAVLPALTGAASLGFQASFTGTNTAPAGFTLNGAACSLT